MTDGADIGTTVSSRLTGAVMQKGEAMDDTISRRSVIKEIDELLHTAKGESEHDLKMLRRVIKDMLPSAQPEIAENLYLYKCFITDKDGLQHEVIHTGDIRRVTGWEI